MPNATKLTAALFVLVTGLSLQAVESKSHCALEFGQVLNKYTEVFDGPSLRAAAGYRFTRNLGLEAAYEYSVGGTDGDNFWREVDGPASFDNIHMISILGTAEWLANPNFSLFSKFGVARGTVDYRALETGSVPDSATLTETNVVISLGVAVPVGDKYDLTFSVKEHLSANFFGLGDSFDSTTVGVGMRIRW